MLSGLWALGRVLIRQHFWKSRIMEEVETCCRLISIRELNSMGKKCTLKLILFGLREKKKIDIYVSKVCEVFNQISILSGNDFLILIFPSDFHSKFKH